MDRIVDIYIIVEPVRYDLDQTWRSRPIDNRIEHLAIELLINKMDIDYVTFSIERYIIYRISRAMFDPYVGFQYIFYSMKI